MSFMSEFKEFASKGNVVDLAVGVIIGAAFAKIVTSLTEDIIMPIVGALFGGIDFSPLVVLLIILVLQKLLAGVAMDVASSAV